MQKMHRRRGVGVGGIKARQKQRAAYESVGHKMEATEVEHVTKFLDQFKGTLEEFARKHKRRIRSEPAFREQFSRMCYEIGVDPLRSAKGFWADALGVGDFYYEVAVKVVEACAATRPENGGLITFEDLLDRLGDDQITKEDVTRAVAKLHALGDGFRVVNGKAVLSVPAEFNDDAAVALDVAGRQQGGLDAGDLRPRLGGSDARAAAALDHLVDSGFAWVDDQAPERRYFLPSVWLESRGDG